MLKTHKSGYNFMDSIWPPITLFDVQTKFELMGTWSHPADRSYPNRVVRFLLLFSRSPRYSIVAEEGNSISQCFLFLF